MKGVLLAVLAFSLFCSSAFADMHKNHDGSMQQQSDMMQNANVQQLKAMRNQLTQMTLRLDSKLSKKELRENVGRLNKIMDKALSMQAQMMQEKMSMMKRWKQIHQRFKRKTMMMKKQHMMMKYNMMMLKSMMMRMCLQIMMYKMAD